MHVDARDVPRSSILVIVATLVSVALFTFSLRLYTRGRLLRSLGTDDWLLLIATLWTVGVLAITVLLKGELEKQTWPTAVDADLQTSILVMVYSMFYILGIGFVKLSAAISLLRQTTRNWYRHTIVGFTCLTTVLTVFWFGSALLFCGPVTVSWGSINRPEAICRLLSFVNSTLDLTTTVLTVLLPVPILTSWRPSLPAVSSLTIVLVFALAAGVAAIVRTYFWYSTWESNDSNSQVTSIMLWSAIELTTGLIAVSLSGLKPLVSKLFDCTRSFCRSKNISSPSNTSRYASHTYGSTQTVIHRPSAPHLLSLRFHDDESNLDFDIETPNTRTRTQTLRSRGTHSRNVSDWSQFSGFTYYTTTANSIHEATPRRSRVVSMNEMELRTRTIGVGRPGAEHANIGVAVTTLHDKPVRDSGAGEEMAELAKLFADNSKDWGTDTSRSVRTSVTTDGTCASRHKHDLTRDE